MIDEAIRAALRETLRAELPAAVAEALEGQAGQGSKLLTRVQLAQALGVSPRTLDALRGEGLPTIWVSEAPRFDFVDVRAWLKTRGGPA